MKGADDKSEEKDQDDGPAPRRAPIGPAMPSQAMLAQAQQAAMDYVEQVRLWVGPSPLLLDLGLELARSQKKNLFALNINGLLAGRMIQLRWVCSHSVSFCAPEFIFRG